MSAPAAIQGSLVKMAQVGTHKSVALTIHIPEELALLVTAAFGWPTMASPVPVALARLTETAAASSSAAQDGETTPEQEKRGVVSPSATLTNTNGTPDRAERRVWADMKPSAQAAIRCGEPSFRAHLSEVADIHVADANDAARLIRMRTGVASRSDLDTNEAAKAIWHRIDTDYLQATGRLAHAR